MVYKVTLKNDIGNQISKLLGTGKTFTVNDLVISDGLLWKGNKAIPIQSILFIEEE